MSGDTTHRRIESIDEPRVSLLVYGRDHAQIVQMTAERPVVIGRIPPSDLAIADMSLSRQHARFLLEGDQVVVEDLGSTNGTLVNGQRVQRAKVGADDRVALGSVTVTVHVIAPSESQLQGLDSHERFLAHLEDQVQHGKYFGRGLALLMVQTPGGVGASGEHVSHWYPKLRGLLRPVDRVGIYGPTALLIALPEAGLGEATALGDRIAGLRAAGSPALRCGIALFPGGGTSVEELLELSRVAARRATPERPVQCPAAEELAAEGDDHAPVVQSAALREVFSTVERLARSGIPVLIQGPTGVGKEVVARAIHERSDRRSRPLRCMNCGAIPTQLMESALFGHERGAFTGADRQVKGVFEEAEGGSVLLDEIGELSPPAQAALLRVLESKQLCRVGSSREVTVDVRIMAATHCDLEDMCRAGRFRWDLLYRLNAMTLRIPALSERPEDIVPLATQFLRQACRTSQRVVRSISPRALELLVRYSWPGNVRELRNVIERAVVVAESDVITEADFSDRLRPSPSPLSPKTLVPGQHSTREIAVFATDEDRTHTDPSDEEADADFKDRVREFETSLILSALKVSGWNQTEAARRLRMPLRTLVHKIRAYGIKQSR